MSIETLTTLVEEVVDVECVRSSKQVYTVLDRISADFFKNYYKRIGTEAASQISLKFYLESLVNLLCVPTFSTLFGIGRSLFSRSDEMPTVEATLLLTIQHLIVESFLLFIDVEMLGKGRAMENNDNHNERRVDICIRFMAYRSSPLIPLFLTTREILPICLGMLARHLLNVCFVCIICVYDRIFTQIIIVYLNLCVRVRTCVSMHHRYTC